MAQPYTFAYSKFDLPPTAPFPNGQTVWRPLLVTELSVPGSTKSVRCFAWLDSGADQCVFPISFAALLGLDPLQMKMQLTGGVGNTGNATYYADIVISIPITGKPALVFSTVAGFTAGLEAQGYGLFGQLGFFESFPVSFNHSFRSFTIFA